MSTIHLTSNHDSLDQSLVANAIDIDAGAGDDTVTASSGADRVLGGAGNDRLSGNVGNDTLLGNNGSDSDETDTDILIGGAGSDSVSGDAGNDTIYGGTGIADSTDSTDTLHGGSGDDRMYGNGGADLIYGNSGADTINGGMGNDTIYGGNDATGDSDAGSLIFGATGSDIIYGGSGNDTIYGGSGVADALDSADSIYGGAGDDVIFANAGDDYVEGGTGDDTLYSGLGNDTLIGGSGFDTYYIHETTTTDAGTGEPTSPSSSARVTINGIGSGLADNPDVVIVDFNNSEELQIISSSDANFDTSSLLQNGVDTLVQLQGGFTILLLNTLSTTITSDNFTFLPPSAVIVPDVMTSTPTPDSSSTTTTTISGGTNDPSAFFPVTRTLTNINGEMVSGAATDDTIIAVAANFQAMDSVSGGAGIDIMQVSGGGHFNLATGIAQFDSIERITVTDTTGTSFTLGTHNISVTGASGNETVTYANANFSAADTFIGGAGSDTLAFSDAATISSAQLANLSGIDIISFAANGNSIVLNDAFVAASDASRIELANGTNTIASLTASGTAIGNGTLSVVIAGTGAVTLANGINSRVTIKDGVNGSVTGGTGADTITGGTGDDQLIGGAGIDILSGGDGSDELRSGIGNDVVTGGAGGDTFRRSAGDGLDIFTDFTIGSDGALIAEEASAFTYVAATNSLLLASDSTQGIRFTAADGTDNGTGMDDVEFNLDNGDGGGGSFLSELNNSAGLTGLGNGDLLYLAGTTAAKTAAGGNGNDRIISDAAAGNTLNGEAGNDTIVSGAANDTINGGNDNDHITGGAGADNLTGGTGDDTFAFAGATAGTAGTVARITTLGFDIITGFTNIGQNDVINLSAADFNLGTGELTGDDTYIESISALTAGAQDYSVGAATGIGILAIQDGGVHTELWFTEAVEAATTANSVRFGQLSFTPLGFIFVNDFVGV